jgi:hypothetical protein
MSELHFRIQHDKYGYLFTKYLHTILKTNLLNPPTQLNFTFSIITYILPLRLGKLSCKKGGFPK